jgi:tetratricopeptide (TPR) repeat protein
MADTHAERELAQRYAANALNAAEAEAFEAHLLTCDECQEEVRLTVGVRRLARDLHEHAVTSRKSTTRFIGGLILLAAGFAIVMLIPRQSDPDLTALGRVSEPPAYAGVSVRSVKQRADSLFDIAMTAYVARRYDDAASGLRAALAAGVDSVPATFFMASANLMAGHAREAAAAYARVIAAGPLAAGYLAEAHYYRARALLQLGRRDDALKELAAVDRDSDRGAAAAALSDSITVLLRL